MFKCRLKLKLNDSIEIDKRSGNLSFLIYYILLVTAFNSLHRIACECDCKADGVCIEHAYAF